MIPGNDDASRAISLYCNLVADAVIDGLGASAEATGADLGEFEDIPEDILREAEAEVAAAEAGAAAAEGAAEVEAVADAAVEAPTEGETPSA